MSKKPTMYTPAEEEVLESPDYYMVRVFTNGQWFESRHRDNAEDALARYNRIREMHYRVMVVACRQFAHEMRVAQVTPAYLSALVTTNANA